MEGAGHRCPRNASRGVSPPILEKQNYTLTSMCSRSPASGPDGSGSVLSRVLPRAARRPGLARPKVLLHGYARGFGVAALNALENAPMLLSDSLSNIGGLLGLGAPQDQFDQRP